MIYNLIIVVDMHCHAILMGMAMGVHCRFIMETKISPSTLLSVKTYIGRIKDPKDTANLHSKQDLLHAVIYDDPREDFDFLDLKKVIEEDNGLTLYTTLVDRTKKNPVSWAKCVETLKNKPPVGRVCVTMHEHPLSFGSFADFAYSKGILTNSDAFNNMKSRISTTNPSGTALTLPPPTVPSCKRSDGPSITAVKKGIDKAISLKKTFDPAALNMSSAGKQLAFSSFVDSPHVGSNLVLGEKEGEYGELSREFWQGRALRAETEVKELKEKVATQKDELTELRNVLSKTNGLKEGFAANADLAQVAVRETQALAARAIIEGLKPEFSALPKITANLEALNAKINTLTKLPNMVKALENLPATIGTLVNLPTMVTALKASIDASTEQSSEKDDARASDSESLLCSINRANKLLANFGFSSESRAFNVPDAVSSILSQIMSEFSPTGKLHDTSRLPPPGPASSSRIAPDEYLLNPRNNNPAPGDLMPTPPGSGDFRHGHGHYPHPYQPAPTYVSAEGHGPGTSTGYAHGHGHGHSYGRRTPPAYGSGHLGHDHSQGYRPGHADQQHHGGEHHGKRTYPFVDSQRNTKK